MAICCAWPTRSFPVADTLAGVLVLHDNAGSSNALKVRILLAELGLEARRVETPIGDDCERPAEHLTVHPFGTVPALIDGELVVTESNAILRYLARRERRTDLYPDEPRAAARIDQLLDALSLQLRPLLWAVEEPLVYGDGHPPASAITALDRGMAAWERLLEANAEVLATFTIADCGITGRMLYLDRLPVDAPRTRALVDRTRRRPSYEEATR